MAKTQKARFGIVANPEKPGKELLRELMKQFEERDMDFLVEERIAADFNRKGGVTLEKLAEQSDMLVVLGGDGTILYMLRELGEAIKPIAAINTGSLGFMTCATEEETAGFVNSLAKKTYTVTDRMVLRCEIKLPHKKARECFGLNEVTLSRKNDSRVIHVEATINKLFANRYTGMGSSFQPRPDRRPILSPREGRSWNREPIALS